MVHNLSYFAFTYHEDHVTHIMCQAQQLFTYTLYKIQINHIFKQMPGLK